MSDLENELLGLAEDDPAHHHHHHKKRGAGGSSRKRHGYGEDSDDNEAEMDMDEDMDMDMDEDMDMDMDDDDDVPSARPVNKANPYPLEGKYIDEDDRDHLDSLPEIDRENILAARQEEIQKFKDSAQLDAMYKMAAGADDDDDYPARKQRKHTSVTDEKYRAMMDLKNKRKLKDERQARRAAKLAQGGRRARSTSVASHDDVSSEEGEISARDSWRQGSPSRRDDRRKPEVDIDALPPTYVELNAARVSRYELVEMMYKDQFQSTVKTAYVRIIAGNDTDEQGRPKYRIHRITGFDDKDSHGHYSIEYKGRDISSNIALACSYGKATRLYRIADISNGDVTESEFQRFTMVNKADGVKNPRRSELAKKHEEIRALRDRAMTEDEVNRQVNARKQANPQAQRQKTVLQVTSLMSSKQLALRRNDHETAAFISQQIEELGADPNTGELLGESGEMLASDARIAKINEQNRRKTRETMIKAHEAAVAKKKAEDAIVRAKAAAAREDSAAPVVKEITISAPPISGLRKGETPQQYVARTVTLNLGDF